MQNKYEHYRSHKVIRNTQNASEKQTEQKKNYTIEVLAKGKGGKEKITK